MDGFDQNQRVYSDNKVVAYYADAEGLQECENYVFEKYIPRGSSILDLGVGAGRTTPFLLAKSRRYVGLDYSQPMIEMARKRFCHADFICGDAADLSDFCDNCFDVVVFSFNGIDLFDDEAKLVECFREVNRVLRAGGKFIFSSQNARAIARRPVLSNTTFSRKLWRALRSVWSAFNIASRHMRTRAFWGGGASYILNPAHGGLRTLISTPEYMKSLGARCGFSPIETVSGPQVGESCPYFIAWYYYVFESVIPRLHTESSAEAHARAPEWFRNRRTA